MNVHKVDLEQLAIHINGHIVCLYIVISIYILKSIGVAYVGHAALNSGGAMRGVQQRGHAGLMAYVASVSVGAWLRVGGQTGERPKPLWLVFLKEDHTVCSCLNSRLCPLVVNSCHVMRPRLKLWPESLLNICDNNSGNPCMYIVMIYMTGVRGSSNRCEQVTSVAESVSTPLSRILPALITESEHVGDDWLVDDVRGSKRKRPDMEGLFKDIDVRTEKKRNRPQPASGGRMSEPPRGRDLGLQTSAADREGRSAAEEIFDTESVLPESTMSVTDEIAADLREAPASETAALRRKKQSRLSSSGDTVPAVGRQTSAVRRKAESSSSNVTSTTVVKPPQTPKPNPLKMRLKVRIGDQLILVPVLERLVILLCIF